MKGGNKLPGERAGGLCYLPGSSSWDTELKHDLKQFCSTFIPQSSFQPNCFSLFLTKLPKKSTSLVLFYLKINQPEAAGLWLLLLFQLMPEPGITTAPECLWGLAPGCGLWKAEHPHRAPLHLNLEFKLQSLSLTLTQTRAWLQMPGGSFSPVWGTLGCWCPSQALTSS